MKRILKMLMFVSLSVIGVLGLVLGGVYLFGGFDEHPVYAENLTFSSEEVINSGTFGLQVDTTTENVNKTSLILETSNGGDAIIDYPKTITLGETFRIAPKKVSGSNEINVGGYVELYARYSGATSNQSIIATCKVLIDVEVEEVSVMMPNKVVELNDSIQIAKQGDPLDTLLDIYPINSLLPYLDRSVFGNVAATSKFSLSNLLNKKIYLEVFSLENNHNHQLDDTIVKFAVGSLNGTENSVIELQYEYDDELEKFVFSNDIFVKPGSTGQLGEMCLKAYYCPTYASQNNVLITNIRENATTTVHSKDTFNITNYTVDNISMNTSDRTIYLNEDALIYINNPQKENNLNILLTNNNDGLIEDSIYKNNIYISVESEDISYILTKSNGDSNKTAFGLNTYVDDLSAMSEWCWKFKLTDFLAYYNYTSSPVLANKIKIKIEYNDGEKLFSRYFYVIPEIHKVNGISVVYASNEDTSFYAKSGVSFQLTKSNFDYDYEVTPTYSDLAYYIPYDVNNNIVTTPSITGNYTVKFNFMISADGTISFETSSDWCSITSSSVVFTQGTRTYSIPYSAEGVQNIVTNIVDFNANEKIYCEIHFTMLENITSATPLFTIRSGSQTLEIDGEMAKFYREGEVLPILLINDVNYAVDFQYYENGEGKFIHILPNNSTYVLAGIGSFSIVAQLVYEDYQSGIIYWLGKSATLNIYTYTDLTSLTVNDYNPLTSIPTYFNRDGIFYDEGLGQDSPKYFYLTCETDQLDALKKYYQKGDLNIEFSQNYGEINTAQYELAELSLSEINQNAITFGSWQEVIINNAFAGYYIPYYIGEIHSIFIGELKLQNIFDIVIYIETDATENIYARFAYTQIFTEDFLSIEIKDNILTSTKLTYEDSNRGKLVTDPLTLTATINNGNFAWNDGAKIVTSLDIKCAFVNENEEETVSHMSERFSIVEGSTNLVNNIDAFHTFNVNLLDADLIIKNMPYYEDGVLVSFQIYTTDSQSDETTHYRWAGSNFVKTINSGIEEGAYLYFKIIGLDLEIQAINNTNLVGYSENKFDLFDSTNGIFSLNDENFNSLSDYSQIFIVTVASTYAEVNSTFTEIEVINDFLSNGGIDISFSYANNEKINIESAENTYVQSYNQLVSGAFEITTTTTFSAPTSTPVSFCSIIYKKDSTDASDKVLTQITKISSENGGNDLANSAIIIDGNNLSFKTITGTLSTKLRLNLNLAGTTLEENIDYDITINSIYLDSDLTVGTLVGENNQVIAGLENQVTINNDGIVLSGNLDLDKSNITNITLLFEDTTTNDITSSEHMRLISFQTGPNVGFYSMDLNFDKNIIVTFTFSFNNGGTLVIQKEILIAGNVSVAIDVSGFTKSSNDSIDFDNATYTVTRTNGGLSFEIPPENFIGENAIYTASSFDYESMYFEDITLEGNILKLKVKYPNETLQEGTYQTEITFHYQPDNVEYELLFSYEFTLTILDN